MWRPPEVRFYHYMKRDGKFILSNGSVYLPCEADAFPFAASLSDADGGRFIFQSRKRKLCPGFSTRADEKFPI